MNTYPVIIDDWVNKCLLGLAITSHRVVVGYLIEDTDNR